MSDRPTPASDETERLLKAYWGLSGHNLPEKTPLYVEAFDKLRAAAVQAESRKLLDELIATAKMTGTLTVEDLTLIRDRHFTLLDSEQQKLGGKP